MKKTLITAVSALLISTGGASAATFAHADQNANAQSSYSHVQHQTNYNQQDADASQNLPSRAEILKRWDEQTQELAAEFPKVSAETWLTPVDTPFGRMSPFKSVEYLIENEIHHRAQGFVYLRELGVTPPGFYERPDVKQE